MRKFLVALLLAGLAGRATVAAATTVNDLCSPPNVAQGSKPCACTASPAVCRFTGVAGVTSPSTLNFNPRRLELAPGARIETARFGTLTIMAAEVELQAAKSGASQIVAPGGEIHVIASGNIAVRRQGGNISRFAAGDGVQGVTLDSDGGDIIIDGLVKSAATADDPTAGDISLSGRNVTVAGDLDVSGGLDDDAGAIDISATQIGDAGGDITLQSTARLLGVGTMTGADVFMDADSNVVSAASLDLQAVGGGGQAGAGGSLNISTNNGSVTLGGSVEMRGEAGTQDFGSAGDVDIDSAGAIILSGTIDQTGPPAGFAGSSLFSSALEITQTGTITCSGQGTRGSGGFLQFDAGRALTLGTITCVGGRESTSTNEVEALAACDLTVPPGVRIDTSGPKGRNTLTSGALITIAGRLTSSANSIEFGQTPVVIAPTAVISPNPALKFDASLGPCPPPPACGNGIPEGFEECDDGNAVNGDGCDANCTTGCGNGIAAGIETCDDGNLVDDDGCDRNCTPTGCGNGIRTGSEECDDGNAVDGDDCTVNCTVRLPPGCGNDMLDDGEACDDGDLVDGDGCDRNCTLTGCGNGIETTGEECDDGTQNGPGGTCSENCTLNPSPSCGNGTTDAGETCDDGDGIDGNGCDTNCTLTGCGNGVVTGTEECDEGGANGPGGTCSTSCTVNPPAGCGNGTPDTGEACDDGNNVDCDGCTTRCTAVTGCGDGIVCGSEQCDEGDAQDGDGCSATCQNESCGNGTPEDGEECDDGSQNGLLGARCSRNCRLAWCGNGNVDLDLGEGCDDANTNECDGCDVTCHVPTTRCPTCTTGSTENCVPCADTIDCDPLRTCGSAACVAGVCTPVTPPSCDDGNRCTTDLCDPARGCVSAPVVCNDTTACDGTTACNPATGQCVSSAAPNCDDADECTDDACSESAPGFRCSNQLRPGLDGARCRLSALQRLIDSPQIPNATRKKLRKQVSAISRKLTAASGTGKKAQKAKKQATKGLKTLNKTIAKARAKMPSETFTQLNDAVTRFSEAFAGI